MLIMGDIIAYLFSLIFTLSIRYGQIPSEQLLFDHLASFVVLFVIFILVNVSGGLYDKQVAALRNSTLGLIFKVQLVNFVIGIIFFYLAPVAIAPKANLIIFFIISTCFIFVWRGIMFPVLSITRMQGAIVIGGGKDINDLSNEINSNPRYGISVLERISPDQSIENIVKTSSEAIQNKDIQFVIIDLLNPEIESIMPFLYSLIFSGVQVVDANKMYESVFDRVPLSMLGEKWFIENSSTSLGNRRTYDILKRVVDMVIALFAGIISLIFYPFVIVAIKLEDGGPIFITQVRVGKNGKGVKIIKFRSMSQNDHGNYQNGSSKNCITKVGKFLRKSRIDELPQFINVLRGDLSLIGPRPELPSLTKVYEKEIPYYNARHLVKPGLSGWAQIYHEEHPHHAIATEETKDKLSYDLYYIKNRSFMLDFKIILRTFKIFLDRAGR